MATDDGETESSESRFWLTNDGLALFLTVSFVGYIYAPLTPYTAGYPDANPMVLGAYVTAFGVSIAWAFGKDAVEAWRGSTGE